MEHAAYTRGGADDMVAAQLTLVLLSLVVLAAHFLRAGNLLLVGAVLLVAAMLAVRRPWAARVVQGTLLIGALEWIRTLTMIVSARWRADEPAARTAIILGAVALISVVSALLFQVGGLSRAYRLRRDPATDVDRHDAPHEPH